MKIPSGRIQTVGLHPNMGRSLGFVEGLGQADCVAGYDSYGVACQDWTALNAPGNASQLPSKSLPISEIAASFKVPYTTTAGVPTVAAYVAPASNAYLYIGLAVGAVVLIAMPKR